MTTYYVSTIGLDGKTLYKGTSLNKAKKVCDACEEACAVFRFVKFNKPMPTDYWNDSFKAYVEEHGGECFVGMEHWW